MRKIVDYQKTKFYEQENAAYQAINESTYANEMDLWEAMDFINMVKSSSFYKERNGNQDLMCFYDENREDFSFYLDEQQKIVLCYGALNSTVILHEIAHHLTYRIAPDLPHHGPSFTAMYLNLIARFGQPGMLSELFSNFEREGVEINHQALSFGELI